MSTPVKTSQIVKDGLRYKAKVSGSPFGETNQYAHTATMLRIPAIVNADSGRP
jgi:hypothetical protein